MLAPASCGNSRLPKHALCWKAESTSDLSPRSEHPAVKFYTFNVCLFSRKATNYNFFKGAQLWSERGFHLQSHSFLQRLERTGGNTRQVSSGAHTPDRSSKSPLSVLSVLQTLISDLSLIRRDTQIQRAGTRLSRVGSTQNAV